ncbi:MAG: hypothetical protein LV481_03430 [Methylacidiphilales bacterium]|nr:hypothetical protein [Candidatus Methylacidiphilales bacterium]
MNAPEPYMTALLRVIYYAILDARATAALANGKDAETQNAALKRIVSLMNVTHNIPMKLTSYEKWDEATFRKFLGLHDKMFPDGIKLLPVYENGLKNSDENQPN